jgi:hypothetical protein
MSNPKTHLAGNDCPKTVNAQKAITAVGRTAMERWVVEMVRKLCGVY